MGAVNTLINLIKIAPLARTALSVPGALSVAAISDLPAASTVSGKIYVVTNPAANTRAIPWMVRSNGTIWESVGAFQLLAASAVAIGYVAPNNTTFGTPSAVSTGSNGTGGGAGSSTKITGVAAGSHGLTNAVSAGRYFNITGGTGWTAGLVKIVDVDANSNIIEVDVPFTSQGIPTYSTKTAEVEILRIRVPPLNDNSFTNTDFSWLGTGSTTKKLRLYHGATGEAFSTADLYSDPNVTSGIGNGTVVTIANKGSKTAQTTGMGTTTVSGRGAGSGTVGVGTNDTSTATDLIFTANPGTNNEAIEMQRYYITVAL